MESIERLQKTIKGEPVDRPPFSFWHHFGLQHMNGEAVASVHIAFARRYNIDFVKVMNDYPYPVREGLSLDRMTDILQMQPLRGIEGSWNHQLLCLKTIHAALGKEKWIVDTIYSPWTILGRLFGIENVIKTAGSRPEIVRRGLEVITLSLVNYIKEARQYINGIYFSMTEADYEQLNPIEHFQLCFPYNMQVLEAAEGLPFNILRLKGHRIFFESVKDYPSAAASWEHFRTKPGLAKGLVAWKRPIFGGIDGETLHRGTPASIRDRFERYATEYLLPGLIVAPTRSLCTNISPYLLEAIAAGVNDLAQFNVNNKRNTAREMSKMPGMEREFGYAKSRKEERAGREHYEEESSASSKKRFFQETTDFSALAAEAAQEDDKEEENVAVAEEVVAPVAAEAEVTENDEAAMLPPEVELDDIDDIFADDFEVYDDNEGAEEADVEDSEDVSATSEVAEDAKPRQAWKEKREHRGPSRDRYERNARGSYGERERRGGYGSRDSRGGGYGSRDSRGGYGNRDSRGGGYGSRDSRGGYGSRDSRGGGYGSRDSRGGYGSRDSRGGYGSRDSRGGGYGERDRRGGYGERDSRGGYGDRERRGGYGSRDSRGGGYGDRERRGGYGEHSRDTDHKVIRIKRQK